MAEFHNLQNRVVFQGFKKKQEKQETRYPVEDPEGVHTTEFPRQEPLADTPGAVSKTEIEVIDLLGEGEIEGLVDGEYTYIGTLGNVGWDSADFSQYPVAPDSSVRWLRSVYWNEVPVVNSNNEYNFQSVDVAFTAGLPNGSNSGFVTNELTVSRNIGERLRAGTDFAKTYRLINKEIKGFEVNVRFNALSKLNTSPSEYGDTEETAVDYLVQWRPLYSSPGKTPGAFMTYAINVRGKISQGYIRTTRVNLLNHHPVIPTEPDFVGWEVKVRRITPDSITNAVRNQTFVDSITEIFGDVFTYPNSALVSSRFSAEYFSQAPSRAFDTKLLKVLVPDNYDPTLKTYDGDWDGTFAEQKQWTDNPAWCFYDLITNKRYGLGKFVDSDFVDKWSLYEVAKYCDTLVPDGEGGLEPRFTCNMILTSREEAYNVINDMASIFRAMTYYFGGGIQAVQDIAKEPIYQFTNASVENGDFNYSSSSRRVRHTVATVRYNDKKNFYKPAIEQVEDFEGIRKYGIRETEMTAFGCTSRGQALRLGKWAILSEILETESVSFTTALDGVYLRPGDIIQIQDNNRTAERLGGRLYKINNSSSVVLDSELTGLQPGNLYYISVITPSYAYESSLVDLNISSDVENVRRSHVQKRTFVYDDTTTVEGADGTRRTSLTLSEAFDGSNYVLTGNPTWIVEGSGINNPVANQWEYYRVLRVEEKANKFNVSAIQYASEKFEAIESGINFLEDDYLTATPDGPIDLKLVLSTHSLNSKRIDYTFNVVNDLGIAAYKVYVKKDSITDDDTEDNTYLVATLQSHERGGIYYPPSNGTYFFRVYSVNRFGKRSITYAHNNITVDGINTVLDITIAGLTLEEEDTDSSVGGTRKASEAELPDTVFKWDVGLNQNGVIPDEIYYRLTIREPAAGNIPKSNIYFERTGLLKNSFENLRYTFTLHDNRNAVSLLGVNGPFRNYDVVVEGMYPDGRSTAGGNFIINGDADYSNPYGYDILAVSNPIPEAVALSDGSTPTTRWQSEQWLTTDGDIKIRFIKSSYPPDLGGAYVYYSEQAFNRAEALGLVTTNKVINRIELPESGNPLVLPVNYTSQKSAYISMSLFDLYDSALAATGQAIANGLNMSNVVRIGRRSELDEVSSSFVSAWAGISINSTNGVFDSDWAYKSYGFSLIESKYESHQGASTFAFYFHFENPMPNTNYVVFGYNPESHLSTVDRYVVIDKFTDKFIARYFAGNVFFGVLHNSRILQS